MQMPIAENNLGMQRLSNTSCGCLFWFFFPQVCPTSASKVEPTCSSVQNQRLVLAKILEKWISSTKVEMTMPGVANSSQSV